MGTQTQTYTNTTINSVIAPSEISGRIGAGSFINPYVVQPNLGNNIYVSVPVNQYNAGFYSGNHNNQQQISKPTHSSHHLARSSTFIHANAATNESLNKNKNENNHNDVIYRHQELANQYSDPGLSKNESVMANDASSNSESEQERRLDELEEVTEPLSMRDVVKSIPKATNKNKSHQKSRKI